ncbi:TetR/AcrR family transcriptional regulator [Dactylosporangium sp. CA-233914]|uniref:TetR/AcrR family transcriptional regulator n=1 Tax=Dactylosporangium sp. CA-233914 TaxID=3239934 RepID=UPI003D91DCCF
MTNQGRRERERAARQRLIVTAARELAEAEGWEAVTTRRLAERVEYSQPVLYSHFKGMGAIMAAVAVEGFAELAGELAAARSAAARSAASGDARDALINVAAAYVEFAERRPALYDAMFARAVDLPFASAETPGPLREAFGALAKAVEPFAGADDLDLVTESLWAALHGLVTLTRGGRMPREVQDRRLAVLLKRFAD